jgi:hypothetical protein
MELPDDWHLSHSAPFYEVNQYWKNENENPAERRVQPKTPLTNNHKTIRVFNTHLRPHQLPTNAKCVYVVREPLDILVSFYYHLAHMAEADGGYTGTPHAFCAAFLAGTVLYGRWQDHMEAWLGKNRNPHCNNDRLLLLQYQDMKQNLDHEATKLARFLGVEEHRLATVVDAAVPHCTFSSMRVERWRYTPLSVEWNTDESTGKPYDDFVRTGRIGDGNDFLDAYFTEELKTQWQDDLKIARDRWLQAGVDPLIIKRYLGQ